MSRTRPIAESQEWTIVIETTSDWHIGTGAGIPGSIDRACALDQDGLPYVPGWTIRQLVTHDDRILWGGPYLVSSEQNLAGAAGADGFRSIARLQALLDAFDETEDGRRVIGRSAIHRLRSDLHRSTRASDETLKNMLSASGRFGHDASRASPFRVLAEPVDEAQTNDANPVVFASFGDRPSTALLDAMALLGIEARV